MIADEFYLSRLFVKKENRHKLYLSVFSQYPFLKLCYSAVSESLPDFFFFYFKHLQHLFLRITISLHFIYTYWY